MRPTASHGCPARSPRPSRPGEIATWPAAPLATTSGAHYLNMAEVEQRAYDTAVTDWERRRYFERG